MGPLYIVVSPSMLPAYMCQQIISFIYVYWVVKGVHNGKGPRMGLHLVGLDLGTQGWVAWHV